MNICKKCGNQFKEGNKFCSNCGEPNDIILQQNNILNNDNQKSNINNNNNNNNNKKNKNNMPYIILAAIVILLIVVISVLLIINNKSNNQSNNQSNNNTNKNEYEDNTNNNTNNNINNNNNTNTNTNTNNTTDNYITFRGFKIKKNNGFDYKSTTNVLNIINQSYFINLTINAGNFDKLKTNLVSLENEYAKTNSTNSSNSLKISNLQLKNLYNTEIIVGEVLMTKTGETKQAHGTWFIINATNNYVFQGFIINKGNTYNYNDVAIVNTLLKDYQYVGNYTSYSSTSDINDIIKEQ